MGRALLLRETVRREVRGDFIFPGRRFSSVSVCWRALCDPKATILSCKRGMIITGSRNWFSPELLLQLTSRCDSCLCRRTPALLGVLLVVGAMPGNPNDWAAPFSRVMRSGIAADPIFMRSRCNWDTEDDSGRNDADDERCIFASNDGKIELSPHMDSRDEYLFRDSECVFESEVSARAKKRARTPSAVIPVCAMSSPDTCFIHWV